MSELDLDAIEARAEAATEGPWEAMCMGSDGYLLLHREEGRKRPDRICRIGEMDWDSDKANAEFIGAARTDVPELVAEVRRLRAIQWLSKPLTEPVWTNDEEDDE